MVSLLVILHSLLTLLMLQRTKIMGNFITMVIRMIEELKRFLITFGMVLIGFILIARELSSEFKTNETQIGGIMLDIFDGIIGNQDYSQYTKPYGAIYITAFIYIFKVMLISFLVAIFINRYEQTFTNIDALRRMNIIRLKNSSDFHPFYGAITITFFPVSVLMLPFLIPLIMFKSERLSSFVLKLQYSAMIIVYVFLGILCSVIVIPLLYLKSVTNSIYIYINNKRVEYTGQDFFNMMLTILFNLPIILLSLFIDLVGLPNQLFRDSTHFEYKYQQSLEVLN